MLNNKFALGTYEINLQNSLERTIIINTMSDVCDYIDTMELTPVEIIEKYIKINRNEKSDYLKSVK